MWAVAGLPAAQRQPHMEVLVLRVVRQLTGEGGAIGAGTPLMALTSMQK